MCQCVAACSNHNPPCLRRRNTLKRQFAHLLELELQSRDSNERVQELKLAVLRFVSTAVCRNGDPGALRTWLENQGSLIKKRAGDELWAPPGGATIDYATRKRVRHFSLLPAAVLFWPRAWRNNA